MKQPKLQIRELKIGYGKKILASNINLEAYNGEFIAMMGNNGCGKSTFIKVLASIIKPLDGNILIDGKNLSTLSKNSLALKLSVVLTEGIQTADLSVFDVVSFGRYPHTNWFGKLSTIDIETIDSAMKMVSITDFSKRNIGSLSDGEKQRALIAKTLAQECDIMILDEPTAHLDIKNRNAMMKLLRNVANEGRTVIISTHDLELAKKFATTIWLMDNKGQIHHGEPDKIEKDGLFAKIFDLDSNN